MRRNNRLLGELSAYSTIVVGFLLRIIAALRYFKIKEKDTFYASMEKTQKRVFVFCNLFLSTYITFFVYIAHSGLLFTGKLRTLVVFFTSIFIFLLLYNLIIFVCSKYDFSLTVHLKKEAIKNETMVLFGGLCWIILLVSLAASFPGGRSPDTDSQWAQVHNFTFGDWHPVIHTLLIWLITRIIDHYAFVVFLQITVFSLGIGYLIATLESWGFGKGHLLVIGLFIVLNPYTMNIMMYPWKDLALTILITYVIIMGINIYYSNGSWFLKYGNVILFALTTGLASIVRHNGFFFTAPLCILIVLLYARRNIKALFSVTLTVLVIFIIKVPLYNVLNVSRPNNVYIESVGVPMTILGDTMVKKPQLLPPEAKEFLNLIATDEEWHMKYAPGSYNSIKFVSAASSIVATVAPKTLLKWVLQTCINARYEAFHAFCDVTDIVWDIFKGASLIGRTGYYHTNTVIRTLHRCFAAYTSLCRSLPVISSLFANVGLLMLLLLLVGIFSLDKNGISILPLVVPSVCYNLGTMMLLCGDDVRFFHFNMVITLPLLFVLVSKQEQGNKRQS
jgi:hypothetical protein